MEYQDIEIRLSPRRLPLYLPLRRLARSTQDRSLIAALRRRGIGEPELRRMFIGMTCAIKQYWANQP